MEPEGKFMSGNGDTMGGEREENSERRGGEETLKQKW